MKVDDKSYKYWFLINRYRKAEFDLDISMGKCLVGVSISEVNFMLGCCWFKKSRNKLTCSSERNNKKQSSTCLR